MNKGENEQKILQKGHHEDITVHINVFLKSQSIIYVVVKYY